MRQRCAICGTYDDAANMELIFMEGTTYPDYWQHLEGSCEQESRYCSDDEFNAAYDAMEGPEE